MVFWFVTFESLNLIPGLSEADVMWTRVWAFSLLACVFPACISLHVENAAHTHNLDVFDSSRSSFSSPRMSLPTANGLRLRGGLVGGNAKQVLQQEGKMEGEGVSEKKDAFDDSESQVCSCQNRRKII